MEVQYKKQISDRGCDPLGGERIAAWITGLASQ